ncbi:aldehyde dehydrogenase family protein [Saccharopolyspora terrae]|uniref:Aldehyde dehydrogenase family protein n=1 Tax=Saccharopolyspora terrae TaxID=2530384 RepID=A0A4R4VHU5_9PSEU|nr:aldehyde dehydrogenase family protein [Saccharopolyspora terrae]TDD03327.1 aldehyde dehydrogenase family protein [Saccharopolyspora terrae]
MTLAEQVRDRTTEATAQWLAAPPPGQVIGGTERTGAGAEIIDVDPGRGETIAVLPAASEDDVDEAVRSARAAFDDGRWSEADAEHREQVMHHMADLLERDLELVTELEALDTGKPRAEADEDIREAISVLRYFAGWATKHEGTVIPAPRDLFAYTTNEPLGVCAAVTPWNYPLPILTYKLAPALATGNAVVAKPSELASLSTLHLARLAVEAGLPAGVFNVVTGAATTGAALAAHPGIDKIAFTGSTVTGRKVMEAATSNLTKVSLELGGKSANVVFADADLETAADTALVAIFTNAGQVCVAGSRLLVQESIHDEFVAKLVERTKKLVVGHALDEGTEVGPIISAAHKANILDFLTEASADGAKFATGGNAIDRSGFFVEPTVVTGLRPDSAMAQQEIFGPVLTVLPFRDDDHAVEIANGTAYGLAAGVWTSDTGRAHRLSRRLRAGTVWINTYGLFHPTLPFGGTKGSGFGRELGASAVGQYTEAKTTVLDTTVSRSTTDQEKR